ncbi:TonB-dependent receptor [Thermoflexibacter ruber]|uniref:Outer membrane receptor proteins, mostly Fe transport n=1 Tax=Thermoflexibacter ruber TaxID=1003 RepID=A0A1I2B7L7_9BACT|nr:TonB-dependent receptor [Thermoflexibacter ruber]SFE52145.1 Outer membrane receptor proteins, mostly Fe transport [Thermoflexibacter ruber]
MKSLFSLVLVLLFFSKLSLAQTISGRITNNLGQAVPLVNIALQGKNIGTTSDSLGYYQFDVPQGSYTLVFTHISYLSVNKKITLKNGENLKIDVILNVRTQTLKEVEVKESQDKARVEAGTIDLNPNALKNIPSPFGDFNQAISTVGLGISGNSELSSAYNVRGGNFEENLVYVNNIEIYRPFLVRAGQQEGLSFINPEMVKSVEFSSGGWQAKYGDKLSSVLSISYKKPKEFHASFAAGLLGGSGHIEGSTKNQKFSYLIGVRQKLGRYLFNTLPTRGEYFPNFTDVQSFFNIDIGKKAELSVLLSYARNRYLTIPQTRRTDFGTFNQSLRLTVDFRGQEAMNYDTWQIGTNLAYYLSEKFITRILFSGMKTLEREFINTEGGYRLCDVNTDLNSPDFNTCLFIRGFGSLYNYGRNFLDAHIFAAESRNEYRPNNKRKIEFGIRFSNENIEDRINQYNFIDSADYVTITERLNTEVSLNSSRLTAYVQQAHWIGERQTLTYGVRLNYWSLNNQWLISPRIQYAVKPNWKKDILFSTSLGLYQQPPFYRELRNFEGQLNKDLKAQTSIHAILGMDWNFKKWNRPFKFISELYYKHLTNVIPYDMDNMRLRYYAQNNAVAYAVGADFRISGEFVEGTESWFNLGLLSTKEKVEGDERGFIRRPTDQRVTLTIFFEDHLPNNPTVRVNMRLMYGSGLPFGVPERPEYRAVFNGAEYNRVDIGFSKIFNLKDKKYLESVWLGLDILNLFGIDNKISYLWIPDYLGNQYAVPNGLSQRFFSLRVVLRK